jgi:hypothetical protein
MKVLTHLCCLHSAFKSILYLIQSTDEALYCILIWPIKLFISRISSWHFLEFLYFIDSSFISCILFLILNQVFTAFSFNSFKCLFVSYLIPFITLIIIVLNSLFWDFIHFIIIYFTIMELLIFRGVMLPVFSY